MRIKFSTNRNITTLFGLLIQLSYAKEHDARFLPYLPEPPRATKSQIRRAEKIVKHYYQMCLPFLGDTRGSLNKEQIKELKSIVRDYWKTSFSKHYPEYRKWEKRICKDYSERIGKKLKKEVKEAEKYIKQRLNQDVTFYICLFNPCHGMGFPRGKKFFIVLHALPRPSKVHTYFLLHELLHYRTNVLKPEDELSKRIDKKFKKGFRRPWNKIELANYRFPWNLFNESLTRAVQFRIMEKMNVKPKKRWFSFGFVKHLHTALKRDYEKKKYKNIQEFGLKQAERLVG